MKEYDDVRDAFVQTVNMVMNDGKEITVRDMPTLELRGVAFSIKNGDHRMLAIPERGTNPFAQIAETLWMLYGDYKLDWLELYIPQCKKWSDDGKTWRGAYGPRLRMWNIEEPWNKAIDQLYEVQKLLRKDPETRQAVITIWNPGLDWVKSKDIPCNNWLQFIIRDGLLHLHVAVRSNDAIYGFSHNDFFSWSVLLQMMAYWANVNPGSITWFAGSYHIYEKHFSLAGRISQSKMASMYKFDDIKPLTFHTDFSNFDSAIELVMTAEAQIRNLIDQGKHEDVIHHVNSAFYKLDNFMDASLQMLAIYNLYKARCNRQAIEILNTMHPSDMKVAAAVYLIRNGIPYHDMRDCFRNKSVKDFVKMFDARIGT